MIRATKIAPFVPLLETAIENNKEMRSSLFFSLATIEKNIPRVRTVVYRGLVFQNDKIGLTICTDSKSKKVIDRDSDNAEICWYMPVTYEQFRIRGKLEFHGYDSLGMLSERIKIWSVLSAKSKEDFLRDTGLLALPQQGDTALISPMSMDEIPNNFLLGVLWVEAVDYLDLNSKRRYLKTLCQDEDWNEIAM